jgi:hypothetical protein
LMVGHGNCIALCDGCSRMMRYEVDESCGSSKDEISGIRSKSANGRVLGKKRNDVSRDAGRGIQYSMM